MPLFTDGSDLEGVETAWDIHYISQLRSMSRMIDGFPKKYTEPRSYRICIIFIMIMSFLLGVIYLKNKIGIDSTFELGHQYISVFMIAVAVIRGTFIVMGAYNKIGFYFLDELHLINHKHMSSRAQQTHMSIHKLCHFYTTIITKMAMAAFLLFNVRPVVNNFNAGLFSKRKPENATFESSLSYALPFDYETNLFNYVAISIFNSYISGSCLSYFVLVDTLISLMVFHLWGHIKILTNSLENFPKLAPKPQQHGEDIAEDILFSEEESNEVLNRLGQNIKHHNLIIDFLTKMSDTFGGVLLVHYGFLQVTGCLMLLMCSPMDSESFARYGPLTVYCFQQLIQSSIIFELLDSSNDALTEAIYSVPWECMHTKYKRIVCVMLIQSQRPMKLKAMDMITVGVQTMTTILKTSFSYFLMIKTFAEE